MKLEKTNTKTHLSHELNQVTPPPQKKKERKTGENLHQCKTLALVVVYRRILVPFLSSMGCLVNLEPSRQYNKTAVNV